MGILDKIIAAAGRTAEKDGLSAAEKAALESGEAYSASKVPFNAPNFKVGDVPADAQDFGQLATSQMGMTPAVDIAPKETGFDLVGQPQGINFKTVGAPQTTLPPKTLEEQLALLRPNGGNGRLMTPVKEDLPAFGDHIPKDQDFGNLAEGQTFGKTTESSLPATTGKFKAMGAGAGALAAGTALLPGQQAQSAGDNSGYNALTNLPNFLRSDKASGSNEPPVPLRGSEAPPEETPDDETDDNESEDTTEAQDKPSSSSSNAPQLSNKPSVQDLAKLISQQTGATKDNLNDALHKRDLSQLVNSLGKAGNLIGSSLSRSAPVGQDLFDQNIKAADQPVSDLQTKIALEPKDPNSAISKNYRDFLKRYGVNAPDNVSAEQIKDVLLPAAEKEELKKLQLKNIQLGKEQTQAYRDVARGDKLDKQTTDRIDKANKSLTAEIASSRSAFGRAANTKQAAEKLEALTQGIDPNDLNTRQIAEIARNMDSMLANGQATISGMSKLIPASASGDVSKISEYISNIPKGAQQGEFVKNMMQTVQREKTLAQQQMQKTQGSILGSYGDLKDKPAFQEMLRVHGLDPEDIYGAGRNKQINQQGLPASQDHNAAVKWALDKNSDGWNAEDAQKILKLNGVIK